jgi:ABC-type multidrug transport system fused ATPase/permease subunit
MEKKKSKFTKEGLQNIWQLFSYLKPYRWEYLLGMFFLLGASLANLTFPKLLGDLVNAGNQGNIAEELTGIVWLLVAILIIQALFSYIRTVLFANVTEKTMADIRAHTYEHLIKLPLNFFNKHRVGELNSRISSDVSMVHESLTSTVADFIRQIVIVFGGIILLVFTSPELTLFMLAIIPAVVLLVFIFGRYIRRLSKDAQKKVAESNTVVEETLQGIHSVKSYTNEYFEITRYKGILRDVAEIGMKSGRYRGAFSSFLVLGLFGALVAVIWKGATMLASGEMVSGELFSFVIYSGYIGGNIGGMAAVVTRMQKFIGATEDLFEIFKSETEPIEPAEILPEEDRILGKIELQDLVFEYDNRPDEQVLNKINLKIDSNKMIALVGPSGAGKSTFASLVLRLYDPTSGLLLFDDKSSIDLPMTSLRSQIALVPQDVFLFGGTIRENIAYGKKHASESEIIEAAKQSNSWEFIERFPEGLNTVVGERGTQLSGGQRQRIAIARAILKNPVILILDEATSSLDSESEKLVQEALDKLMNGRTSIVIAHRLSTIRTADQIVVLDKGSIVESGTHDELLSIEQGVYRNLSHLQFSK